MLAGYLEITNQNNGHTILVKDSLFDINNRDPSSLMPHEYFHVYQRVHDKHNMAESMLDHLDELSTRGAYWFIEGTPQYSAEVLGADNGGTKFRNTFKQIIDELYFLRQQKDEKYKQGLSISKHITLAGHESVRSTAQSGQIHILSGIRYISCCFIKS